MSTDVTNRGTQKLIDALYKASLPIIQKQGDDGDAHAQFLMGDKLRMVSESHHIYSSLANVL
jgi:hypothetical protein